MIRPKELNILGKEYKVVYIEEVIDAVGHHDPYPAVITLWNGMGDYDMFMTLLHEVIHAIDSMVDINLSETKTSVLAVSFADFLTRNKIIEL